jgi:hypothetical protein
MIEYGKFLTRFVVYAIAYIALSIVSIGICIVITRGLILSISDCNGMECFGKGVLMLIFGALLGLIISTIAMFFLFLRLEGNLRRDENPQNTTITNSADQSEMSQRTDSSSASGRRVSR